MKQSFKLLVLILSTALILCSILAISASANTDEDGALSIEALTLSYGDRTQMIVAVAIDYSEKESVEVSYVINGETKTAALHPTMTYTEGGVNYPIFYTEGIAAKDMADEVTFEAHIKGSTYTPVNYELSVAKYFYTRLYRDGVINAEAGSKDAKDTALYLAALEYGARAQEALLDEPGVLPTDLCFVWCDDGATVNGASKSVLVTEGTKITPTSTAAVAGFDAVDAAGNVVATVPLGESLTVTETVKLVPTDNMIQIFEDGALYNDYLTSTLYGADGTAVDIKDVTDMSLYANYTALSIAEDPVNAANKVLKVVNKGRSSGSTASTKLTFTNAEPAGNCYIFETKIYADNIVAGYTGAQLMFINGKGSTLTLGLARESAANGGGLYITTSGQYAVPATGTRLAEGLTLDSWISIRAEYYHNGASAVLEETYLKLYINDNLVFDGNAYYSGGNLKSEITGVAISHYRNGNSTIYYDNMSLTRVDKEYVASTAE